MQTAEKRYFRFFDIQTSKKQILIFAKECKNNSKNSEGTVCIRVPNVKRKLYIACKDGSTYGSVLNEVYDELLRQIKLTKKDIDVSPGFEQMGYWFDDVEALPRGKYNFIILRYSYNYPEIKIHAQPNHIVHIFGGNESVVKRFMVDYKVRGHGFLSVAKEKLQIVRNIENTYTNYKEYLVKGGDNLHFDCRDIEEQKEADENLVSATIRIRTIYNRNQQATTEIIAILLNNVLFLRKVQGLYWDVNRNSSTDICEFRYFASEHEMFKGFISYFCSINPDIIIGHRFYRDDLPLLLYRMKRLKVDMQLIQKLSRLRYGLLNSSDLMRGRLICDIWDFACAKNNLRGLRTYDLQELSRVVLKDASIELERFKNDKYGFRAYRYYVEDSGFHILAREMLEEAYMCRCIEKRLHVLKICKGIARYSGCRWSDALLKSRSVINEYLLLHKFDKHQLVPPDHVHPEKDVTQKGIKRKRAQAMYTGGLVIEPKSNVFSNMASLLDFKSLYPSVVISNQLCFSPYKQDKFLYKYFKFIVGERRKVREKLRRTGDGSAKEEQDSNKEVKEYVLKLLSNTLYGLLGREGFRFSRLDIAQEITEMGQRVLKRAIKIAEGQNVPVIYGHTDSIKIDTGTCVKSEADSVTERVLEEVNEGDPVIQMKVDGNYDKCIIYKKTKYVARDSDSGKMEYKGTEITASDSPAFLKEIGKQVVEAIFDYDPQSQSLMVLAQKISGLVYAMEDSFTSRPASDFIITKKLGSELPKTLDQCGQPHVKVAKWMHNAGMLVKMDDPIEYIMCTKVGNQKIQEPCHPYDLLQRERQYNIDYKYYSHKRMRTLVKRLCEPIDNLPHLLFMNENSFRENKSPN